MTASENITTGDKIKSQIYNYLSKNLGKSEKDIQTTLLDRGINARKLYRLSKNLQELTLKEASTIAEVLGCTVSDLIK